jgi:hypothetical protein
MDVLDAVAAVRREEAAEAALGRDGTASKKAVLAVDAPCDRGIVPPSFAPPVLLLAGASPPLPAVPALLVRGSCAMLGAWLMEVPMLAKE